MRRRRRRRRRALEGRRIASIAAALLARAMSARPPAIEQAGRPKKIAVSKPECSLGRRPPRRPSLHGAPSFERRMDLAIESECYCSAHALKDSLMRLSLTFPGPFPKNF